MLLSVTRWASSKSNDFMHLIIHASTVFRSVIGAAVAARQSWVRSKYLHLIRKPILIRCRTALVWLNQVHQVKVISMNVNDSILAFNYFNSWETFKLVVAGWPLPLLRGPPQVWILSADWKTEQCANQEFPLSICFVWLFLLIPLFNLSDIWLTWLDYHFFIFLGPPLTSMYEYVFRISVIDALQHLGKNKN